jgi:PAS domain S-box-containing protein
MGKMDRWLENNETAMSPKKPIKILVVDDTAINQRLVQVILEAQGYDITLAETGASAIELANQSLPSLILLDVGLPDMDGYEVCRQLKSHESTRQIPVIFVTGLSATEDETRSFEVGGADFITKPINARVLLARVKTHLAQFAQRRTLEGMFRDVIEQAPVMFILTDLQWNIVQTNAQTARHFGYSRQELVTLPLMQLLPDCMACTAPTFESNTVTPIELSCHRKDGSTFPGDATFSRLITPLSQLHMVVLSNRTERRDTLKRLHDSNQLVRELAARNEATRENERKHIAREVHDELGQVLTALRMDLSLLKLQYGSQIPELPRSVDDMKSLVDRAITGVRNIAMNLRPEALNMGLVPAMEWLRDEFTKHTGIRCVLAVDEFSVPMDEPRSVLIYRIVQESLTNISRYAQASAVKITLRLTDSIFYLSVQDNGVGFDVQAVQHQKSYGLLGMRERALTLGGDLTIESTTTGGTLIYLEAPVAPSLAQVAE